MSYTLGIELGPVSVAVAVCRNLQVNRSDEGTVADTPSAESGPGADLLDDEPDLAVEAWLVDTQALLHAALGDIVAAEDDPPDEATLTYVARQYLHRVGDPVPFRIGDVALSGAELAVRLIRLLVDDLTGSEGEPPAQTTITYPPRWGRFRVAVLTGALADAGLVAVSATPVPDAVAVGFAQRHGMVVGGRIAVLNVGATGYDTAVVARTAVDAFDVLRAQEGPGGALGFHDALHAYVRSHISASAAPASPEDQHSFDTEVVRGVDAAVTALATDTEATVHLRPPGQAPVDSLRVVRSEFEAVIRPRVVAMIDTMHQTLVAAQMTPPDLLATVIVGTGATVPLVAQQVGASFGSTVTVDDEPATSVAVGAAVAAWFVAAAHAEQEASEPDTDQPENEEPDEQNRRVPLWAWWSRQWHTRRAVALVPGGALAALAIIAALIAASMSGDDSGPAPGREGEQRGTTANGSALTPSVPLTPAVPIPVPTTLEAGQEQPGATAPPPPAASTPAPRRTPTAQPTVGPTAESPADIPQPSATTVPDPLEPPPDPPPATASEATTTPPPADPTTPTETITASTPTPTPSSLNTGFAAARLVAQR